MADKGTDKKFGAQNSNTVNFKELIGCWAESLGRHQIPLQDQALDINTLLGPDAVHHELIQAVVRKIYCANRCGHLEAPVDLEDTFSALGQIRAGLLGSAEADVDQIDLLDSIGWYTRQYFGLKSESAARAAAELPGPTDNEELAVSGIGAYR